MTRATDNGIRKSVIHWTSGSESERCVAGLNIVNNADNVNRRMSHWAGWWLVTLSSADTEITALECRSALHRVWYLVDNFILSS